MRCVMVMFDSLNRRLLPPYHAETFVHAPNFARLAERSVTFDTSYVCSMPCMPARRDFHTGRPNFLHTSWGQLEAYDDSVPAILQAAGVCTHLDSDHYHYWEDGGGTYHNRYGSWRFFRGQEGDEFIGQSAEPRVPENMNGKARRSDWVNREHIRVDAQYPQSQTFASGLDFIERNHADDGWFLHIETFDPHEPFTTDRRWRDLYPPDAPGTPLFDWPAYGRVGCSDAELEALRRQYAALVSKCDASLGDVLDAFDRHGLWDDTMLVVWTDHGFLLGEHGWLAKNQPPMYDEIARTPFFVWDPRTRRAGERRSSLVQPSIDLGPTLLGFFGHEPTPDMRGYDLAGVIERDEGVRDAAIFGYFGQDVNVTDGRYVYMRAPDDGVELGQYTLALNSMRNWKGRVREATLREPFSFTKGMPVLRLPKGGGRTARAEGDPVHLLFDMQADPGQSKPIEDADVEARLRGEMARLMASYDAPDEQFARMGLERPEAASA